MIQMTSRKRELSSWWIFLKWSSVWCGWWNLRSSCLLLTKWNCS